MYLIIRYRCAEKEFESSDYESAKLHLSENPGHRMVAKQIYVTSQ